MTAKKESTHSTKNFLAHAFAIVFGTCAVVLVAYFGLPGVFSVSYEQGAANATSSSQIKDNTPKIPPLDIVKYDTLMLELAHVATSSPWYGAFLNNTTASTTVKKPLWPVRRAYPTDSRAILPFKRIVAYYGNFYSKGMGILGEYSEQEVLDKLLATKALWEGTDPSTPVVPAIEYIDVTAQGSAGKDGKYRLRMPDSQVDKALEMAHKINGIVILDIQVGFSTLQEELPLLKDYLSKPELHLAIDPEFSMKGKYPPGREIGTFSSADVNYAIDYLSQLVKENNLPPKVLIVHRFTNDMVTGVNNIKPTPEVQVVMVMDGWGSPQRKQNTYSRVINPEPVQFTGLKLFYKNDLKEDPPRLLTMDEIFKLTPIPSYIQYQ
ncbi:hypothetical protein KW798_03265 [Candidatus Parcubacteria bacterium]|nr:hypothetical protein [Candidatus Parcubacteria bacterium]